MKQNRSNGQMTAQVNIGDISKGGFDLSFNNYGTGKIGRIIPTRAQAVHPGDSFKCDSKVAVQFEPLAVPMLANMEVKQEHFYVPYNTVWEQWDEFISGGEQLDYSKVVPNISMKSIMQVLYVNLSRFFNLSFIRGNEPITTIYPGADVFIFHLNYMKSRGYASKTSSIVSAIVSEFESLGMRFQAKDLLKYVNTCVENLVEFASRYNSHVEIPQPLFLVTFTPQVDAYKFYDFIQTNNNYSITSKYIKEYEDWYRSQGADNHVICIPTDFGVEFCSLLYDFIKPLIGLGSNIDYLNMNRWSLSDFIYLISRNVSNFESLETVVEDLGNDTSLIDLEFNYGDVNGDPMSVLNLRANYFVWYQNYRDVLLETDAQKPSKTTNISDSELITLLLPRQRCWAKDAFTTALDNPGTGNVGVPITKNLEYEFYEQRVENTSPEIDKGDNDSNVYKVIIGNQEYRVPTMYLSGQNKLEGSDNNQYGFSLFQLDAAQRAQKWIQKALYFGNRINDFFYLHFKVKFLDARLRLPELLHSSSDLVKIDTIMNNTNITTEVNGTQYQTIAGDRAGFASAYDNGSYFDRFIEEHGVMLSYLTVVPFASYAYGQSRDYSRLDIFDFPFSEFATLGMDAVYSTEMAVSPFKGGMFQNTQLDAKPEVFGYQGRYYDYKANQNQEHGEMLDTQDMYTFGRKFLFGKGGKPRLNYEFVHCFPDLDMFVVNSPLADTFRYDVYHQTAVERELPVHSIYI